MLGDFFNKTRKADNDFSSKMLVIYDHEMTHMTQCVFKYFLMSYAQLTSDDVYKILHSKFKRNKVTVKDLGELSFYYYQGQMTGFKKISTKVAPNLVMCFMSLEHEKKILDYTKSLAATSELFSGTEFLFINTLICKDWHWWIPDNKYYCECLDNALSKYLEKNGCQKN